MFSLKKNTFLLFLFLSVYKLDGTQSDSLPVVLWHGMGDSCCFSFSLGAIKKIIETAIPNIYVYSIRIGNNEIEDVEHSYFGNVNQHILEVCQQLSTDDRLKNGYNAIGFSQGAQFLVEHVAYRYDIQTRWDSRSHSSFYYDLEESNDDPPFQNAIKETGRRDDSAPYRLRAVIQRCPNAPPVKNFISVGGQHQGVYGLPNCGISKQKICDYVNRMIKYGAYLKFVQEKFIQATYWHDPYQEKEYKMKSTFMADVNNERYINETYKENLQKLNAMVLIKFNNDTIVQPPETEWFGFYKPGQAKEIQSFEETDLYHEDRLGLQTLYKSGRIVFLSLPGNHLQFTKSWFIDHIIKEYLI